MKRCVDSNIFQRGILIAILINTLSMGIEHHNQVTCLYILSVLVSLYLLIYCFLIFGVMVYWLGRRAGDRGFVSLLFVFHVATLSKLFTYMLLGSIITLVLTKRR